MSLLHRLNFSLNPIYLAILGNITKGVGIG